MTTKQIIRAIELDTRLMNDSAFSNDCRNAAAFRVDKNMEAIVRLINTDPEAEAYWNKLNAEAHAAEEAECKGHPAGPNDAMGETVYCDGGCR